jgi:hypothetical protein
LKVSPLRVEPGTGESVIIRFDVSADSNGEDDEIRLKLADSEGLEVGSIRLRRTGCRIETALLHHQGSKGGDRPPLDPGTRASLLWYGWNRCTRLVGIKRFGSGLSGSEVLVFRPRLAVPRLIDGEHFAEDFSGSAPSSLWDESWGAWLLVKSGEARNIRKEWARHEVFLRDRLTPFMARSESFALIQPAPTVDTDSADPNGRRRGGPAKSQPLSDRATLISSFLGGDLIRAEPLEFRLRSGSDASSCRAILTRTFETLAAWHQPGREGEFGQFRRYFKGSADNVLLFGKTIEIDHEPETLYDLTKPRHRQIFGSKITWDDAFQSPDHLNKHLVGSGKGGLLGALRKTNVRYSLIHGDLNPRNILCDRDYAWLIDFEHAGYGPTLHDFAWLEANLRYFCLTLSPGGESLDEAATRFERHLLDHLHGSESSLEPVRQWAAELGADPDELHKLAAAIVQIRQLALPYCVDEYADHRDYLAVLYLAVLSLLRGDRPANAAPANYRSLVRLSWVLEEQLSRIHGLEPFDSERATPELRNLIDANWLLAPGGPERVAYIVRGADGPKVLGPVAATRGIEQSDYHHLDVFDHTLSVLAYIEALLDAKDPLDGFVDPGKLDATVARNLADQGLRFPPGVRPAGNPLDIDRLGQPLLDLAGEALREAIGPANDDPARLLLKWCALLHDVGKPGVRSMLPNGRIHVRGHEEYGLQLLEGHLKTWFDAVQAERLSYLILRHHDHNNLAKEDHEFVQNLDDLRKFAINPGDADYQEFDRLSDLAETAIARKSEGGARRRDFPLLILHGFADSLASRGHHSPIPIVRRAEIYVVCLALWQRRDLLKQLRAEWNSCQDRTVKKVNPSLHELIESKGGGKAGYQVLGLLRTWAWDRVKETGSCPSPEEFVAEARRRLA